MSVIGISEIQIGSEFQNFISGKMISLIYANVWFMQISGYFYPAAETRLNRFETGTDALDMPCRLGFKL